MIKHICDSCKGDYNIVESNHYTIRDNYRLYVQTKDGDTLEICKACIGKYFFNLQLMNINGECVAVAPPEQAATSAKKK